MDFNRLQELANTIDEIGNDIKTQMDLGMSQIEKIEDPKQKELARNMYNRVQKAIENKDSKEVNSLINELKNYLKTQ